MDNSMGEIWRNKEWDALFWKKHFFGTCWGEISLRCFLFIVQVKNGQVTSCNCFQHGCGGAAPNSIPISALARTRRKAPTPALHSVVASLTGTKRCWSCLFQPQRAELSNRFRASMVLCASNIKQRTCVCFWTFHPIYTPLHPRLPASTNQPFARIALGSWAYLGPCKSKSVRRFLILFHSLSKVGKSVEASSLQTIAALRRVFHHERIAATPDVGCLPQMASPGCQFTQVRGWQPWSFCMSSQKWRQVLPRYAKIRSFEATWHDVNPKVSPASPAACSICGCGQVGAACRLSTPWGFASRPGESIFKRPKSQRSKFFRCLGSSTIL